MGPARGSFRHEPEIEKLVLSVASGHHLVVGFLHDEAVPGADRREFAVAIERGVADDDAWNPTERMSTTGSSASAATHASLCLCICVLRIVCARGCDQRFDRLVLGCGGYSEAQTLGGAGGDGADRKESERVQPVGRIAA